MMQKKNFRKKFSSRDFKKQNFFPLKGKPSNLNDSVTTLNEVSYAITAT